MIDCNSNCNCITLFGINLITYAAKYSSEQSYNTLQVNQYQTLTLRPVNPMPEYLGKINTVGYIFGFFTLFIQVINGLVCYLQMVSAKAGLS